MEKNIFKQNMFVDVAEVYIVKQKFDRNHNSDILMLIIAYCEWRDRFTNRNNVNLGRDRTLVSRLTNNERQFCKSNYLDPIMLKETHRLVADLKLKLKRLNIFETDINQNLRNDMNNIKIQNLDFEDLNENSSFDFNDFINDPRQVTLFKYILAGAFYGKYIKCQYNDIDKIRKINSDTKNTFDIKKTISIRG